MSAPTCKQPLRVAELNAGLAAQHQILDRVIDGHLDGALRHDLHDCGTIPCTRMR